MSGEWYSSQLEARVRRSHLSVSWFLLKSRTVRLAPRRLSALKLLHSTSVKQVLQSNNIFRKLHFESSWWKHPWPRTSPVNIGVSTQTRDKPGLSCEMTRISPRQKHLTVLMWLQSNPNPIRSVLVDKVSAKASAPHCRISLDSRLMDFTGTALDVERQRAIDTAASSPMYNWPTLCITLFTLSDTRHDINLLHFSSVQLHQATQYVILRVLWKLCRVCQTHQVRGTDLIS